MLYALKSFSKDTNRELTSLIQLLKSKKVAEHWIEVFFLLIKCHFIFAFDYFINFSLCMML